MAGCRNRQIKFDEMKWMRKILTLGAALLLAMLLSACKQAERVAPQSRAETEQEPRLEVAPLEPGRGPWKIATAETINLTISAPGAKMVQVLYRPEGTEDDRIELKRLTARADRREVSFSAQVQTAPDFAGELWAEVHYPDGAAKVTEPIFLTTRTAAHVEAADEAPASNTGGSVGTDESARSDKLTGGRIEKASLKTGDPHIRLTVNAPTFLLTLWQNNKEIKTYPIGIGRKNFPVPIGEREARAIIFNPRWIPPHSAWVRQAKGIEPGERIAPDDPRNPLGKIKIPLGEGYLIHEATKPSDIGHLVSHGSIRMLRDDLFDLAEKIIAAYGLPVSNEEIAEAKQNADRFVVKLDSPLLVDINYDLQVVEGGLLRLYPDVYDRGAFSIESLRAELQSSGVDASKFDEPRLKQMIDRVSAGKQFAVRIADLKAGRLSAGKTLPVPTKPLKKSLLIGKVNR
jgi:hypothetical protein